MANLVFANEFVKHDVDAQEFAQSIGVTYQINPNFFIGVEVEHVAAYEDWKDASHEWYAVQPCTTVTIPSGLRSGSTLN